MGGLFFGGDEVREGRRVAMCEVLSNPMDLTVVAQMLAEGHSPDLFRLRQQLVVRRARPAPERGCQTPGQE